VLGPFMDEGDVLGHEPMGIVEEVGPEVTAWLWTRGREATRSSRKSRRAR
jgi:threonine dehydrogenase-like Zn-dependent dehydrogenase